MAEANPENAKPKKKLLMFIIIGIVMLVLLVGGGLLAFLMLRSDHAADEVVAGAERVAEAQKETKKKKAKSEAPPVFEKLPLFTVNLNSEYGEVMQTEIVLEVPDVAAQAAIKQVLPKIQSAINKLLSAKAPDEVKTVEGREKLEVEIREVVNKLSNLDEDEGVLSVNFTSFIVR